MSGNQKSFGWVVKFYDRLLVMIVLLAVVATSVTLSIKMRQDVDALKLGASFDRPQRGAALEALDTEQWADSQLMRTDPFQLTEMTDRTLVSELRVRCANEACQKPIPFNAEVCPFCQYRQPVDAIDMVDSDGDGIPDEMELKFDMDPFDPTDAQRDLDGDGFTAREEFCSERMAWISHPRDPSSYPPPHIRLRWARITSTPFPIEFRGVQELPDGIRIQLNLGGSSRFARMGEVISVRTTEGLTREFVVREHEEIFEQVGTRRLDRSTVTLESEGRQFTLVKNVIVTREDREAWMVFLNDMQRLRLRIGDEFELMEYHYKVVDIKRDDVLVQLVSKPDSVELFVELDMDAVYSVRRITDEEMSAMRRALAPPE